jgi:hypothetical protein
VIRPATLADIPRMVEMGRVFYRAAWRNDAYDPEATATALGAMIGGAGAVFVSERGMIGGVLAPVWCAPTQSQAVELFWWSRDGQGEALLDAFEAWARDAGAGEVRMSNVCGLRGEAVARKLEARGYAPCETSFRKELQ